MTPWYKTMLLVNVAWFGLNAATHSPVGVAISAFVVACLVVAP